MYRFISRIKAISATAYRLEEAHLRGAPPTRDVQIPLRRDRHATAY